MPVPEKPASEYLGVGVFDSEQPAATPKTTHVLAQSPGLLATWSALDRDLWGAARGDQLRFPTSGVPEGARKDCVFSHSSPPLPGFKPEWYRVHEPAVPVKVESADDHLGSIECKKPDVIKVSSNAYLATQGCLINAQAATSFLDRSVFAMAMEQKALTAALNSDQPDLELARARAGDTFKVLRSAAKAVEHVSALAARAQANLLLARRQACLDAASKTMPAEVSAPLLRAPLVNPANLLFAGFCEGAKSLWEERNKLSKPVGGSAKPSSAKTFKTPKVPQEVKITVAGSNQRQVSTSGTPKKSKSKKAKSKSFRTGKGKKGKGKGKSTPKDK